MTKLSRLRTLNLQVQASLTCQTTARSLYLFHAVKYLQPQTNTQLQNRLPVPLRLSQVLQFLQTAKLLFMQVRKPVPGTFIKQHTLQMSLTLQTLPLSMRSLCSKTIRLSAHPQPSHLTVKRLLSLRIDSTLKFLTLRQIR